MDKRKLAQIEKRLREQRDVLLGMVERTEGYGREANRDISQDPADQASNSYTKELLFSQSTNERQILKLIDEALERIAEGEYGECVNCGQEIPPKRLEAIPWARYCIRCQELQEKGMLAEEEVSHNP
jgi:DnaK suppressor protein